MKKHLAAGLVLAGLALFPIEAAHATHDIVEDFDEAFPFDLTPTEYPRQIVLLGVGGTFSRDALGGFAAEPLLPVSNGGDLELLWDNGAGPQGSLALTPDDEAGNYHFLGLSTEAAMAVTGDLENARPKGGLFVRHTGPEEIAARKFYAAYGAITPGGGGFQIQFFIQKWFGAGFINLDSGPAASGFFPVHEGENFKITFEITEPDADNVSTLTAHYDRLSVVDGALTAERLADLEGTDRFFSLGQVGFYVEAGSSNTMIAFDDNALTVSAIVPTRSTSWGAIKAMYR